MNNISNENIDLINYWKQCHNKIGSFDKPAVFGFETAGFCFSTIAFITAPFRCRRSDHKLCMAVIPTPAGPI
jgi:hypothetical protein